MADYAYSEGSATSETIQTPHNGRKPQKKLSGVRLARKREIDRQAQRSSRVKTKNLIAHLESRIEELTQVHDSGNVRGLIEQLEEQRKQNEELRSTLQAIGKLVGGKTGDSTLETPSAMIHEDSKAHTPYSEQDESERGDIELTEEMNLPSSHEVVTTSSYDRGYAMYNVFSELCSGVPGAQAMSPLHKYPMSTELPDIRISGFNINKSLHRGASILGQPRLNVPTKECNCCDSIRFTNSVLERCSKMQLRVDANQRARDTDIVVRAVLYGWEVVTQKYLLDPVWAVLRHVDQAVFSKCAETDRLAVLRLMILMLRYRANRCEQNLEDLPFFLRELPAQRLIPHIPLVDFLVWPAVRERFILYPHNFCSEKFFSMFWSNFRFIWRHSIQETYIPNYSTGLYQFSPLFIEQTFDLQHWRMTNEFLEEFPQLKEDMPCMIPIHEAVEFLDSEDPFGFEKVAGEFGTRLSNSSSNVPAASFFVGDEQFGSEIPVVHNM